MFRAPEYRKITLLSLSPQALATPESVTDADAKTYYEQHKAQYGTPEKREVRQILFPNEADAKAARDKIAAGTSFSDIAKARSLKASDTDIGMVTQAAIIDPAVGQRRLRAQGRRGQPAGQGQFRHRAGDRRQDRGRRAEELRRRRGADQKADRRAQVRAARSATLRDKIEDEKAAGATLAETGKKLGLKTRSHRRGRPRRQRPRRQAGCRSAEQPERRERGLLERRRRRQRGAATAERRLPLLRRQRHHALARPRLRRRQGQGRKPLARRRDRQAAENEGRRDARQAEGRQHA